MSDARERPRLKLQPRSVNKDATSDSSSVATTAPSAGGTESGSSIFGGARPVDTATRERAIEERLLKGRDHDR